MQPFGELGEYVNFLGAETGQDAIEAAREAYGPDTYDWLVALKNRFDPDNLFRLNHNIVPTSA
jgi:FAD/FMN-containing dehydrogenase